LRGEQEGLIIGYVSIMRDITERKRAEEELREASRRIENILESITDAVWSVDREWRFTYINEHALGIMRAIKKNNELTHEDILGKDASR